MSLSLSLKYINKILKKTTKFLEHYLHIVQDTKALVKQIKGYKRLASLQISNRLLYGGL